MPSRSRTASSPHCRAYAIASARSCAMAASSSGQHAAYPASSSAFVSSCTRASSPSALATSRSHSMLILSCGALLLMFCVSSSCAIRPISTLCRTCCLSDFCPFWYSASYIAATRASMSSISSASFIAASYSSNIASISFVAASIHILNSVVPHPMGVRMFWLFSASSASLCLLSSCVRSITSMAVSGVIVLLSCTFVALAPSPLPENAMRIFFAFSRPICSFI